MPTERASPQTEVAERFAARGWRHARKLERRIVAGGALLVVAAWSFTAWSLWRDYRHDLQAERRSSAFLADAFGIELALAFDGIDWTFATVQAALPLGPSGFEPSARAISAALDAAGGPDANLAVFTADGRQIAAFGPPGRPVPPPVPSNTDTLVRNGSNLLVTRWFRTDTGVIAGAAEMVLDPARLLRLSRQSGLVRQERVLIVTPDGAIRIAFQPGSIAGGSELPAAIQALGGGYPGALRPGQTATYVASGPDGIRRMISLRQIERPPLQVAVVHDVQDALGYQRGRLWLFAGARILMTLIVGGLTFLLAREVHRRTAREIELAYEKCRLSRAEARIAADRDRLAAADRDLQISRRDLDAANHIRAQFIAHMSHELRTPLHAIIGFAELIRDQVPPSPPHPPLAAYAQDIWSSGSHLLSLINNVLDVAKVDSGTVVLREETVLVSELVQDSLTAIHGQAAAQSILLQTSAPDDPVAIIGDRTRLLQVLINVLSNAVKFTPRNGQVTFEASLTQSGDLTFSVADTGIGMSEAEIDVALQPFGQVDNSAARRFDGTGLGLPIACRMVQVHGGKLVVNSAKGQGTCVTVTLPARRVKLADSNSPEKRRSEMA